MLGLRILQRTSSQIARQGTRSAVTSTSGPVLYDEQDNVGIITLNQPHKLNCLSAKMGDAFLEVVDHLRTETSSVNAVVLTGAGQAFSAGGDLKFLQQRYADTPSRNTYIMRQFYERFLSVRDIPVPVIAAINGAAIGAGAAVAAACDIRIAASSAKIGFTFVKLGLHPGMGSTHFLPSITNHQIASKLLLTGETITGKTAKDLGLVLESSDNSTDVLPRAIKIAHDIAAVGPIAVRSCVRTLRLQQEEGLERALWREADAQSQCYASNDLGRGVQAMIDRKRITFENQEHYNEEP